MIPPLTPREIDAAFESGAVGCCLACSGVVVHGQERRDVYTPGEYGPVYIGSFHADCQKSTWQRLWTWCTRWWPW